MSTAVVTLISFRRVRRSQSCVTSVSEQPGHQEEQAGLPFLGPAGKLLNSALEEAGIDRKAVYVSNAVKHFEYDRGATCTRHIHNRPNVTEIRACHPWLVEEIRLTKPKVLVVLGTTAAQSLLGRQFRATKERGRSVKSELASTVIATVHSSSVLRAPDDEREQARQEFVADIRAVAKHMAKE